MGTSNAPLQEFATAVLERRESHRNEFARRILTEQKLRDSLKDIAPSDAAKVLANYTEKVNEYHLRKREILSPLQFEPISKLGAGGFGVVFLVRKNSSSLFGAMKVVPKRQLDRLKLRSALSECEILLRMKLHRPECPFMVPLQFLFQDDKFLYIVMDFLPGGDLMGLLIKYDRFTEAMCRVYIAEIAEALNFLHQELGYTHRDLKPDNVLVDAQGHMRLLDFGLARRVTNELPGQLCCCSNCLEDRTGHEVVGTMEYMAPECADAREHVDERSDFWSLAAVLYECVFGRPPWMNANSDAQTTLRKLAHFEDHLTYPNGVLGEFNEPKAPSAELMSLLKSLFCRRKQRLNYVQLKNHAWFNHLAWDQLHLMQAPWIPPQSEHMNVASNILESCEYLKSAGIDEDWAQACTDSSNENTMNATTAINAVFERRVSVQSEFKEQETVCVWGNEALSELKDAARQRRHVVSAPVKNNLCFPNVSRPNLWSSLRVALAQSDPSFLASLINWTSVQRVNSLVHKKLRKPSSGVAPYIKLLTTVLAAPCGIEVNEFVHITKSLLANAQECLVLQAQIPGHGIAVLPTKIPQLMPRRCHNSTIPQCGAITTCSELHRQAAGRVLARSLLTFGETKRNGIRYANEPIRKRTIALSRRGQAMETANGANTAGIVASGTLEACIISNTVTVDNLPTVRSQSLCDTGLVRCGSRRIYRTKIKNGKAKPFAPIAMQLTNYSSQEKNHINSIIDCFEHPHLNFVVACDTWDHNKKPATNDNCNKRLRDFMKLLSGCCTVPTKQVRQSGFLYKIFKTKKSPNRKFSTLPQACAKNLLWKNWDISTCAKSISTSDNSFCDMHLSDKNRGSLLSNLLTETPLSRMQKRRLHIRLNHVTLSLLLNSGIRFFDTPVCGLNGGLKYLHTGINGPNISTRPTVLTDIQLVARITKRLKIPILPHRAVSLGERINFMNLSHSKKTFLIQKIVSQSSISPQHVYDDDVRDEVLLVAGLDLVLLFLKKMKYITLESYYTVDFKKWLGLHYTTLALRTARVTGSATISKFIYLRDNFVNTHEPELLVENSFQSVDTSNVPRIQGNITTIEKFISNIPISKQTTTASASRDAIKIFKLHCAPDNEGLSQLLSGSYATRAFSPNVLQSPNYIGSNISKNESPNTFRKALNSTQGLDSICRFGIRKTPCTSPTAQTLAYSPMSVTRSDFQSLPILISAAKEKECQLAEWHSTLATRCNVLADIIFDKNGVRLGGTLPIFTSFAVDAVDAGIVVQQGIPKEAVMEAVDNALIGNEGRWECKVVRDKETIVVVVKPEKKTKSEQSAFVRPCLQTLLKKERVFRNSVDSLRDMAKVHEKSSAAKARASILGKKVARNVDTDKPNEVDQLRFRGYNYRFDLHWPKPV